MDHIASKINKQGLIEIKFNKSWNTNLKEENINNDIFKNIRDELLHINFWHNLKK